MPEPHDTKEPWPFFLALVLIIVGAFQKFVLLVRTGIQVHGADDE
jgi:hypothetical protein